MGDICIFKSCDCNVTARGLCKAHYYQDRRGEDLRPLKLKRVQAASCSFQECGRLCAALDLCAGHYAQARRGQELVPLGSLKVPRSREVCLFETCTAIETHSGLCSGHYAQKKRGKPLTHIYKNKPARHKTSGGYILVREDGHPNSYTKGSKSGMILEHTLVMSEYLGRPLRPKENVHHRNGIRDDNRIENLELWSTSQPSGQRVDDKTAWAVEWLRQYDPELLKN